MSLQEMLAGLPPFDRLATVERRAALREATEVPLRTGRALCCQGERAERCWMLVLGRVRGLMYRSDETTIELGRSGPADWLGLAELLLDSPYLSDLVAEEHCTLAAFSRAGEVACTQEQIAEAIGATRETVNRHLQHLQDEGLVRVGRGVVTVVDPSRLGSRGT